MMRANEPNKGIDYTRLKNKRILLAEDVKLNQFIAKQILESWGCHVVIANNGREALELLQENFFDCVLMDVQMPELDGIAATEMIRKLPDAAKATLPVLALTANSLNSDKEKYIKAGMNDCIAKPIDELQLFKAIIKSLAHDDRSGADDDLIALIDHELMQPEEKLYDLTMIHSVSGGDALFIKKMISLFIETVPQNVVELKRAAETENWDQAAKLAHKLKSTIDSIGIKSIHKDIRSTEANAKQKINLGEMPALIQKIELTISACVQQLQAEIQ